MLSDRDIKLAMAGGDIEIDPFTKKQLQPASYDVRLGDSFAFLTEHPICLDLHKDPESSFETVGNLSQLVLRPNEFVLGVTQESIKLGPKHVARIEGKSGLGRLGLLVHATAGFVDPGWEGPLTLELKNLTSRHMIIYPGMLVAQISFQELATTCASPYAGSHRTEDDKPKLSQFWRTFE